MRVQNKLECSEICNPRSRSHYNDAYSHALEQIFSSDVKKKYPELLFGVGDIYKAYMNRGGTREALNKILESGDFSPSAPYENLILLAVGSELDYVENNGALRNGFVYIKNNHWIKASSDVGYKVAPLVDDCYMSTLHSSYKELSKKNPDSIVVVHLGFGDGGEALQTLDLLVGKKDEGKPYFRERSSSNSLPGCTIVAVDQSRDMMAESAIKVQSSFNVHHTLYDIKAMHADFMSLDLDKALGGLLPDGGKLTEVDNRLVVLRGITSGNYDEDELISSLDSYVRNGDHIYLDTSLWDGTEASLSRLASMYSNNDAYRRLVSDNWLKLLNLIGAPKSVLEPSHLQESLKCRYKIFEGSGGKKDMIGRIEFVYKFNSDLLVELNIKHGLRLPEEVVLYFSQRRRGTGFISSLEERGYEVVNSVKRYSGDNKVMGLFLRKI